MASSNYAPFVSPSLDVSLSVSVSFIFLCYTRALRINIYNIYIPKQISEFSRIFVTFRILLYISNYPVDDDDTRQRHCNFKLSTDIQLQNPIILYYIFVEKKNQWEGGSDKTIFFPDVHCVVSKSWRISAKNIKRVNVTDITIFMCIYGIPFGEVFI